MKKTSSRRLHEEISARIRELASQSGLGPGDRLPPERQLAEVFHVSRNSVREAIKTLEQRGVVVSKPGSGTFIADRNRASLTQILGEVFTREGHRMVDIFELRLLLEPQIASLAAERLTDTELGQLALLLARQEQSRTEQDAVALDIAFHDFLAAGTKNTAIVHLMEALRDILWESRDEALQSSRRNRESIHSHKRLYQALCLRDPDLARIAMEDHLRLTRDLIFSTNNQEDI